jgi:hypothetical protein
MATVTRSSESERPGRKALIMPAASTPRDRVRPTFTSSVV